MNCENLMTTLIFTKIIKIIGKQKTIKRQTEKRIKDNPNVSKNEKRSQEIHNLSTWKRSSVNNINI